MYVFQSGTTHEGGRLAYFGFANTDCGVIVHDVQPRDNGGWLCQLIAKNQGDIIQNATDIVPLFAGQSLDQHLEVKHKKHNFTEGA